MKVLISGDRNWSDYKKIVDTLEQLPPNTVVVHGACRGADEISGVVAKTLGFGVKAYPASWKLYGMSAGPKRNQEMLDREHLDGDLINICFAFHDDIENSRGTSDMVKRATKAGIKVVLVKSCQ